MKKSIEAFNRSPWYLQVILGLVGLAVAVALAIPLSWLVEILWGYVLQLVTIVFNWISSWMPAGKLFSWKAVFDAVPKIVERLPLTLGLTIAGAFFGLILALVFAVVKINRVRILYPIQAVFVSFLRGTPILVQLMLTYYGIPLFLRYLNGEFGLDWNINEIPPAIFAITAFAFNEAVTPHASSFGMTIPDLGYLASVAATFGRVSSPLAAGVIVISGIAGVSPIEVIKRSAPVQICTLAFLFFIS